MSYKDPIAQVIADPVLLDKEIKAIQTTLATLSWLEKSFGRAFKWVRMDKTRKVYYPAIFQVWKKDYYDGFPNDNIKSYSFIYPDPEEITENSNRGAHEIQRDISIILFFDLEQIDNTLEYRFTEKLKEDVIIKLATLRSLEINKITDEVEEVFNDFTVDQIKAQYLKDKYGALKFECTIFYSKDNCTLNVYNP